MTSKGLQTWIPSTLIYLENSKNEILMLHRVKKKGDIHKGKYNGLGGKLELGETPSECALREVREESGLTVQELNFKGQILFPKFDKSGNDWFVFLYHSTNFTGELIENSAEGRLEWIAKSALKKLPLWEGDKIFLDYVFSPRVFDGYFVYEDGKLVDHRIKTI